MEEITTAEEFFSRDNGLYTAYSVKDKVGNFQSVCSYEKAIEFAKLHVEAALKEVSEKAKLTNEVCEVLQKHWFEEYIDKDSILNSYSLDNIK